MYLFDKVKTIASCDGLSAAVADEAVFIRYNTAEYVLLPGFCDVHVHFREPGFSYKETILSGSLAAAHGGYTAVCTMPNLNPVPDCPEKLRPQNTITASLCRRMQGSRGRNSYCIRILQ